MEELYDLIMLAAPLLSILEILGRVFTILYMHYAAKYRNHTLSAGWYICGVFFVWITLLVFLVKKKDFPNPDNKVCQQCGKQFPGSFQVCSECMIDLPATDDEAKEKDRKKSKGFGVALIIVYVISVLFGSVYGAMLGIQIAEDLMFFNGDELSYYEASDRLSVNSVFYDKKGNSYENEQDVLLYDENGHVYTYVAEEYYDEEYDYTYYDEFYVREDGKKYFAYDCYVTEDGWFYCDKGSLLELYSPDTSTMTEEELDDYYDSLLDEQYSAYRYYDYPYVDADGNFYYCAYEASWNEKGELITAENDLHYLQVEAAKKTL